MYLSRGLRSLAFTVGASLLLVATALMPIPTNAAASTTPNVTPDDVTSWIDGYSQYYSDMLGVDYDSLYYNSMRIASCETGHTFNPYAIGDHGTSVGPFQFHNIGIWYSTPQYYAGYSIYDPEANVAAGVYSIASGWGPANWYTCWRTYYP